MLQIPFDKYDQEAVYYFDLKGNILYGPKLGGDHLLKTAGRASTLWWGNRYFLNTIYRPYMGSIVVRLADEKIMYFKVGVSLSSGWDIKEASNLEVIEAIAEVYTKNDFKAFSFR